ncbi:MAG: EAL domain-containing protein [Halioglobus sp.]|nr:EAL domain-containing protein [Halioglobus sp.]
MSASTNDDSRDASGSSVQVLPATRSDNVSLADLLQGDWPRKALVGLSLVLTVWLGSGNGSLQRLDNLFYDALVRVHERDPGDRFLVVAIDDRSLREIGRWPWPRRVHAELIDKLTAAGAAAVGMDILFAGADSTDPDGDAQLARAIADSGRVVLALAPEAGTQGITEVAPEAPFAQGAAAIGHVDLELDRDGLVRRVFLKAGLNQPRWSAFGLALLQVAGDIPVAQTAELELPSGRKPPVWSRDNPTLIAYTGAPGNFDRVSYADVLHGAVDPALLRGRIVLVGADAAGMGDYLSTPQSSGHSLMSGVEVNANVAATLLDGRALQEAQPLQRALFTALLLLPLALWLWIRPRLALPGFILTAFGAVSASLASLYFLQLWLGPSMALALASVLYVSWSWLDLGRVWQLSQRLGRQLQRARLFDDVTGLPNRPGFERKLHELLEGPVDEPAEFGILVISMGRHRSVIDLAGIRGNDDLHRQIADRLAGILPGSQQRYRLDGAEFAVVVEQRPVLQNMERIAARAVQSLLRSFTIDGHLVDIVPNIGGSHYPGSGDSVQALIDNAYTAMHWARKDDRCSYHAFSSELREDVSKRSTIIQALRSSTWKEQLNCVYQPQICLHSRRIVGVETLVRWPHASLGNISPAEFIPLAESEGLIVPISNWILQQACVTAQGWRTRHGLDLRVAVNISALQLNTPDLPAVVRGALSQSGLPAASLELELTETALLSDHNHALEILHTLKSIGVEIAIDDFGTGYSSLTYLKDFPVDRVKIDQSFISDIHECRESAEIASSIIAMSHRMGLEVIAEGVERTEHLAFLLQHGCEEAQGFFVARPMPAPEFERFITTDNVQLPGAKWGAANMQFTEQDVG